MVLIDFFPTRLLYTACLLCVLPYVRVAVAQDSVSPVRVVFWVTVLLQAMAFQ